MKNATEAMLDRLSDAIYDFEHERSNSNIFLHRLNRLFIEAEKLLSTRIDWDLEYMVNYISEGNHLKNKIYQYNNYLGTL